MPPKNSAGSKRGGKQSKADKEKKQKEEADQKAQAEEDERVKKEAEEKDKKKKAKKEAEEKRRLENEERKRRKGQLHELDGLWESNRSTLVTEYANRRVQAKWDRYMRCDGSPDPTIAGEINTYMNLWREQEDDTDVDSILKESVLTLGLIDELEFLMRDTPAGEIKEAQIAQYKLTVHELEVLLQQKLDLASHDLLLKATNLADPETMNLQQVISNGVIIMCMWGNLSKNPRIKSHEFAEKGFTFELPKILTLSDCAFRVLFTKYDHYSHHCKTFLARPKKKVEDIPPAEEKPEGEEGEKKESEEGEKKDGEEGEDKPDMEKENTEDVMAALNEVDDAEGEEKKEEEEGEKKEEEPLEEDYEIKTPVVVELGTAKKRRSKDASKSSKGTGRKIREKIRRSPSPVDIPPEPIEWEDFDGDDDVVDLRAYHVMGGIFHFNLLQLPPQPKNALEWVITQVVEPELVPLEYVVDTASPVPPPSAASKDAKDSKDNKKDDDDEKKEKREERPPIGVNMRLPEDVYFSEEPQVCRWDHELCHWRLDGFTDHSFNEEQRMLTFKTSHFGTMTLVQDAHINMPFQSWEIRPRATNRALLTIIAAIVEVEIDIKDDLACLVVSEDKPELQHLKDQWMTPDNLIVKLRAAGLNVFPASDSSKYVSIQNKNSVTEERLYQQMALTASCMAYSWSKWNNEVKDENRLIIQGAEHLDDEPLLEEDWSLFQISAKRTTKLKMTEFDDTFSEDHAEGTEFHADLYHMTMDLATEEGKDRIRETSYKFIDSVYQLLKGSRLVTYS